jgi:hypothetical protein
MRGLGIGGGKKTESSRAVGSVLKHGLWKSNHGRWGVNPARKSKQYAIRFFHPFHQFFV